MKHISHCHMDAFERALMVNQADSIRGYVLMRDGEVVREKYFPPYEQNDLTYVYSVTKSFTSTAIGMCVDDGLLSVDNLVIDYFLDYKKLDNPYLSKLTIHHLLAMNTGHTTDPTAIMSRDMSRDWLEVFFSTIEVEPGTHFVYNSLASHMLSVIVQKVAGKRLDDFLQERLFAPLGITDFKWQLDNSGKCNTGGWGLQIGLKDLAKLGQLYLAGGMYNEQRIISQSWVELATAIHSDCRDSRLDWAQGYGYQFWRGQHNTFRADGALGQYCIVMPEHNAVLVLSSFVADMQALLDKVWTHVLPALTCVSSSIEPTVNGQTYGELAIKFTENACELTYQGKTLTAGRGHWVTGPCPNGWSLGTVSWIPGCEPLVNEVSAYFYWQDNALCVEWRYRNFPHHDRLTLEFDGDCCVLVCPANGMANTMAVAHQLFKA